MGSHSHDAGGPKNDDTVEKLLLTIPRGCSENDRQFAVRHPSVKAQAPQCPEMVPNPTLLLAFLGNSRFFLIGRSRRENMIEQDEKIMSHSYHGSFLTFCCQPPELSGVN